jgi:hypothetical protein
MAVSLLVLIVGGALALALLIAGIMAVVYLLGRERREG